ncbi:MAG: beta-galactosidase, partial [Bryobacteraceae bacterium]
MLRRFAGLSLVLAAAASLALAQGKPIPQIVKQGAKYTFLVDGKPFLMLGGQVDNFSAWLPGPSYHTVLPIPDEIAKVLPGFKSYNANTIEFPVHWGYIEPKEGEFDFAAFDQIVRDIRAHSLRAIVLWFGTWKGGDDTFLPDWVRSNPVRFPNALDEDGKALRSLSPHGTTTLEADRKAFTALMKHIRAFDENDRTVILVQVENEAGILGSARDHSAEANKLFNGLVPAEFATALKKQPGSWQQVFGRQFAEEAFTTYYMARYINSVAQAGKDAYPLPMCLNVWMGGPGSNAFGRPGDSYPSGGGQAHTLDLWKATAPAIDVIAPDIYDRSAVNYRTDLSDYGRPDNPLLMVETGEGKEYARYCFMAIGEYAAIGFAQFGVGIREYGATADGEFGPQFADVAADFRLLRKAAPVIAELQGTKKLQSAIEEENIGRRLLSFDRYDVLVRFPPAMGRQPG